MELKRLSDLDLTITIAKLLEQGGDLPDYTTSLDACVRDIIPEIWRRDFCIDILSANFTGWSWEIHIHKRVPGTKVVVRECTLNRVARTICEMFVELCEKENTRLRIEKEEEL